VKRRALAVVLPLVATRMTGNTHAQPAPRRIGFLVTGTRPAQGEAGSVAGVRAALREAGLAEGTAFQVEVRYGDTPELLDRAAAELLAARVEVIVVVFTPAAHAARRATERVPIVMAGVADPVATGLVASLARPGGNITGVAALGPELAAKNLEVLRQWLPGARRIGVLAHATDPFTKTFVDSLQAAGPVLGFELDVQRAADGGVYPQLFSAWTQRRIDALVVQPSLPFPAALALAHQQRLPSCSFVRAFALAGGLFAYGAQPQAMFRKAADYVRRVLDGARPADLPVQQNDRFALALNLRTAGQLALAVPAAIRLQADEVIE
jgi:putative ABC transport system substrate-binding protein